ncbi:hypothetical protein SLS58_005026 [Diplodia intermedia]|uniref:Peptidase A1 domain-containing protein n=1 Tax=Diplodia intermedia TaxID=856260 RepID=A0ABR3TSL6_9PEZI
MSARPAPTPYAAIRSEKWDGIDGNWSSFRISIGNPGQNFRVLVSTRGAAAWVPVPDGCQGDDAACPSSRGVELFDSSPSQGFVENRSNTWSLINYFSNDVEKNLELKDSGGMYGYDAIRLGFTEDTDAVKVNHSLVVGIFDTDYWLGLLGMSNAQINLDENDKPPSLIQVLNDTGTIPSQSYGHTAGAHYRGVHGNLVIGGYDQSRFHPPAHNFTFAEDLDQFLVVGVQSIYTNFSLAGMGDQNLVSNGHGHLSAIDSTVSQLWLPGDVCDNFAAAFGLSYDEASNYYLVNKTAHNKLLAANPTLKFRLGNRASNDPDNSVDIALPYAAFDLYIEPPAYPNTTRYFPIRRARNDTQYTLGRVLLQEAYLTVDYERGNFSLAQANYSDPMPASDIRAIHTLGWSPASPSPALSSGAKVGIAVGAVAGAVLALAGAYLCWWRPRRRSSEGEEERKKRPSVASAAAPTSTSTYLQEPPPHYQEEGKHYDYWATMQRREGQQRDDGHDGRGRRGSVVEMATGAEHQATRPELDGVGVGGGSYELPVGEEQGRGRPVHEMDVGGGDAAAVMAAAAAVAGEGSEGGEGRR